MLKSFIMPDTHVYVQLEMVLPRARFGAIPALDVPPGYAMRMYQSADESEILRVLNLQDWGAWDMARLQPWLARVIPESWYMLWHEADERLAATAMGLDDSSAVFPSRGELGWVAADPGQRGKGLGKAVCIAATARMIQAGYRHVHLYTEDWRLPAISIYFKLGYVPSLYLPEMHERWRAICAQLARPFEPDAWLRAIEEC
jgi:mycothiol synthase